MGQSGPAGYDASWTPEQAYGAYQALPEAQQQGYVNQYLAKSPNEQQDWLNATGQTDPTGGMNNPAYIAPPVPDVGPNKSPAIGPSGPTNTWTPDPVGGVPPPAVPPVDLEGGNAWDDLTSPRFQAWFSQQLDAGQSPGLNFTGGAPTSPYGTYNTLDEQAALMAQFQALPPEVRAAYVQRYMSLTPEEQTVWRNAFGADNGPDLRNDPQWYTGPQSLSNAGRPADATSNMWYPDEEIARYYMNGEQSPYWTQAYGVDGSGGAVGGWGPQGEWRWAPGGRPQPVPPPLPSLTPTQQAALRA